MVMESEEQEDPVSMSEGLQIVVATTTNHSHSSECEKVVQSQEEPLKTTTMNNIIGVVVPPSPSPSPNVGESKKVDIEKWYVTLLWLRIAGLVLCMLAFSILAADNQTIIVPQVYTYGLTQITVQKPVYFYGRQIFKYSFSAYVIGFVYSAVQISDLVKYFITKKHTLDPKLRCYYNVAMDQFLTYLLVSASSSAATNAAILKASWGAIKFVTMANAAIALSFFAFMTFASASLVSGFILTSFKFN